MNRYRFFYQPSPILATIDWCWTFIILFTGIVFWLEVTHFQWITLWFFIAFFTITGLELFCRQLVVRSHFLLVFNFLHRRWRTFDLRTCSVQINKHRLLIRNGNQNGDYWVSYRSIRQIKRLLDR